MSSSIVLQPCPKARGAIPAKARPVAETLAWVKRRLSRVFPGFLEETRRIDSGRLGIPVYISLGGPDARRITGRQGQMGKGTTPQQAEVSAVMELVERYSLEAYLKHGPAGMVQGAVPGRARFDLSHLERSVHDVSGDLDHLRAFFETLPMGWTWARNLSRDRDEAIPFRWFHQVHETNGAAAGNTIEEAALQAVCEVVERHVTSLVAHERRPLPAIAPASCTAAPVRNLLDAFLGAGIHVHLMDFSLDTGIPSVGALAWDPASYPESSELVFAVGTATDPVQAGVRALTEVAQLAADFQARTRYHPGAIRFETLDEARFLLDSPGSVSLLDLPSIAARDFREELDAAVRCLARHALEVYLVDITDPVLSIPAVYAVVPGAHFRERTRREGVLFHAARIAATAPDPFQAESTVRRLHDTFDGRYETAFFLGFVLERAGRDAEALAWFTQALEQAGAARRTAIQLHVGACSYRLGRHDEAIAALKDGTTGPHRDAEGLKPSFHLLGACLMARGRYEEAMEALQRAAGIDSSSVWDHVGGVQPAQPAQAFEPASRVFAALEDLDTAMARVRGKLEKMHVRIEV